MIEKGWLGNTGKGKLKRWEVWQVMIRRNFCGILTKMSIKEIFWKRGDQRCRKIEKRVCQSGS